MSSKGLSFTNVEMFFIAPFPEILTTAIPLTPGGVEQATMVIASTPQGLVWFRCLLFFAEQFALY